MQLELRESGEKVGRLPAGAVNATFEFVQGSNTHTREGTQPVCERGKSKLFNSPGGN